MLVPDTFHRIKVPISQRRWWAVGESNLTEHELLQPVYTIREFEYRKHENDVAVFYECL
jgi:hypothetical protein